MKLYHFTARRFVPGIQREGLTRGVLLESVNPVRFRTDHQWLTTNPDWDQAWADGTGLLPYKRNEVRLTLIIPPKHATKLKPWRILQLLVPETADRLSAFGDPENWWIYQGRISPAWIAAVDELGKPSRSAKRDEVNESGPIPERT